MAATVLLYNVAGAKAKALGELCAAQGVRGVSVPPAQQGKTIGALLGLPLPAAQVGERAGTVPGEMLVLSGFTAHALDAFLDGFAAAGVPPIPLKAVVTAHNLAWTGVQLYLELLKERRGQGGGL